MAAAMLAVSAVASPPPYEPPVPPTVSMVAYGPHQKNVLSFWKAPSSSPTPVLIWIHGGGWMGWANRPRYFELIKPMLAAGVSLVEVEYRYIADAMEDGVNPPVKAPMQDCARALQFVRSKAAEWGIDKNRIVCAGESAGACTCLWLAFHPDLADPRNSDPVARESTRPSGVAVFNAQTSLDPQEMREWIPGSTYGGHAFGILQGSNGQEPFEIFLARRMELLPLIREYSPYALACAGAPPVYMLYSKESPALGQPQKDPTHSPNFGVKLQERLRGLNVPCELVYPAAADVKHGTLREAVLSMLG